MAKTGLLGPYKLTFDGINDAVARASAGTYVSGHKDAKERFCVDRIGRSDTNVNGALRALIGTQIMFKFCYFSTSREAFEKECEIFHDFRPGGSFMHPARAPGTSWQCPRCRRGAK